MNTLTHSIARLLYCAPLSLTIATPALGQAPELQEIIVTATRQESSVNRVPLSIAAQTQEGLDQQGIKSIADLQRTVPALAVSQPIGGVQNFAIRGILSTQGAAKTGVYLDDTALQKRNLTGPGGLFTSNGSPAPPLFDLERVEVLRGPQGTLYGGSSQGGTVRFIAPEPSLTEYTGAARAEVSTVEDGEESYEFGAALGGPIATDKVGFRLSALSRHSGGYIDMLDPYNNGRLVYKDANSSDTLSVRGALLWAPTDALKTTLSWLHFEVKDEGGLSQSFLPGNQTFTTASSCYNTTRPYSPTPPTARTAVTCPPNAVPGQTVNGIYQRPSLTYGPFDYLKRNEALGLFKSPDETTADVASFTLDYDFGGFSLKSITSYLYDKTNTDNSLGPNEITTEQRYVNLIPGAAVQPTGMTLFSIMPDFQGTLVAFNKRTAITEEIRLTSAPDDAARLSWVAGLYYTTVDGDGDYCTVRDQELKMTRPLWGITPLQAYGAPQGPCTNARIQELDDEEIALFGEGTYKLTDQWTAIAGVRVSQVEYSFNQAFFGTTVGWLVPTYENTGLTSGSVKETPVTPKLGIQYQFNPTSMMYLTGAQGFRAGGVNTPLTPLVCGQALTNAGLTAADIPTTYDSDSVWSYELGGKFRLFDGRVQVNSSVYRVDWSDVQLTVSGLTGCPQSWVQNAGSATSQGFDVDTQANLFGGLSAILAFGYTKAEYTETARAPTPVSGPNAGVPGVPVVREGDRIAVPEWQGNIGLRYDFTVGEEYDMYVRGDYFYQGEYFRGPGPGVTQYLPDSRNAPATEQVNVRAGVTVNGWDLNIFANNLLDSDDEISRAGGRSGCSIAQGADCTTFAGYDPLPRVGTLRPREIGLQTSYRF